VFKTVLKYTIEVNG